MSAQFTLDAIREAADAKYGATEIVVDENTTVRLLNPLRLTKAKRDGLLAIQDEMKAEGADQLEVFRTALRMVAESEGPVNVLIEAIGDDLALLGQVFSTYTKGTSAGEA